MKLNLPKAATMKAPAAVWKRIFAFLIDILLIDFLFAFPFKGLFKKLVPSGGYFETVDYLTTSPRASTLLTLTIFLIGVLALLYFAILEYKTGQTIGKMLMNIQVEPTQKKGHFYQYLIRSMFLIAVFPFVILWILDPLFMIFSKEKRRLSEILSRTRTIESINLR